MSDTEANVDKKVKEVLDKYSPQVITMAYNSLGAYIKDKVGKQILENTGLSMDDFMKFVAPQMGFSSVNTFKYRDGSNTWSGKGKPPNWVNALLTNEYTLAHFKADPKYQS